MATVAASLPAFLSPHLPRIVSIALHPAAASMVAASDAGDDSEVPGKRAANRVLSLLATGVESRLLVPAVCSSYGGCITTVKGVDGVVDVVAAARLVARLLTYVQEVRGARVLLSLAYFVLYGRLFGRLCIIWVTV